MWPLGCSTIMAFASTEQALTEFQRALELRPNILAGAPIFRFRASPAGQMGSSLLEELKKSIVQDPGDAYVQGGLAETYIFLRMWKDAQDLARHALTIDPHEATSMRMLLLSSLNRTGSAQEPFRLLASFPPDDLLLPNTGMFDMVIGTRGETFVLARDFKAALEACEVRRCRHDQRNGNGLPPKRGFVSWPAMLPARKLMPRKRASFLEARQREHPQDVRSLRALSWVYLALNRKKDAINIARTNTRPAATGKRRGARFGKPGCLGRDSGADRCCQRSGGESEKNFSRFRQARPFPSRA